MDKDALYRAIKYSRLPSHIIAKIMNKHYEKSLWTGFSKKLILHYVSNEYYVKMLDSYESLVSDFERANRIYARQREHYRRIMNDIHQQIQLNRLE